MTYLPAITITFGLVMLTISLIWLIQPSRDQLRDRLQRYGWRQLGGEEQQRLRQSSMTGLVAGVLERSGVGLGVSQRLAANLARADLKVTVSEYLLISAVIAVVTFVLTTLISGTPVVGVVFGAVSLVIPNWYVKGRENSRIQAVNAQLPDVLGVMASSLKAGLGMLQAMELVAKESGPPLSQEFSRVVYEVGLGLSQEQALDNLVRRVNSGDIRLMVTAFKVQHEVGGNMVSLLEGITETVRERTKLQRQIQVLTATQRASGYIISGLPVVVAGILLLMDPSYLMGFFTPGWYFLMPVVGVLGILLGFLAMKRIVAIDV